MSQASNELLSGFAGENEANESVPPAAKIVKLSPSTSAAPTLDSVSVPPKASVPLLLAILSLVGEPPLLRRSTVLPASDTLPLRVSVPGVPVRPPTVRVPPDTTFTAPLMVPVPPSVPPLLTETVPLPVALPVVLLASRMPLLIVVPPV